MIPLNDMIVRLLWAALLGSAIGVERAWHRRPAGLRTGGVRPYIEAWSQPGALTGMINWYRALFRFRTKFPDRTVHTPTRVLWGERDAFLLAEMAHESLRYCTNAELFTFANATHWLQHEEPARVSELLIDFFRG